MGLNSEYYSQLRTNILSTNPLPSLDRAYQLVIQDERVRLASGTHEAKPADVSALLLMSRVVEVGAIVPYVLTVTKPSMR